MANWKVWIPFQVLNFRLVPLKLQVSAAGALQRTWELQAQRGSSACLGLCVRLEWACAPPLYGRGMPGVRRC